MKQQSIVGETRTAEQLRLKGRALRVCASCSNCGIQRWVRQQSVKSLCRVCAAKTRQQHKETNHASTSWIKGIPQVGDQAVASEIGRKGKGYYTWLLCPDCGKGRWVQNRSYSQSSPCFPCANKRRLQGDRNPRWNGGVRFSPGHGYYVRIAPDHPYYGMVISAGGQKYIAEHRLVMAMHLKRPLERWEIVHHINGDNTDNRIDNLELMPSQSHHLPLNLLQTQLYDTQKRVTELEAEVTLLRAQLVGMPIPSEAIEQSLDGTCRDLTGDILNEDEEKVHSSGKPEGNRRSICSDRQPLVDGASAEQSADKLRVKRGNLKTLYSNVNGNPVPSLPKSYLGKQEGVETRDEKSSINKSQQIPPPHEGEEIVHTSGKPLGSGRYLLDITSPISLQEPTRAALGGIDEWRWVNAPNSGNAKRGDTQANPDLAGGENHWARVETLQSTPLLRTVQSRGEEKVHPSGKSEEL